MKILNPFAAPKPIEVAKTHLRLAQLQLLDAHREREAANARVNTLQESVRRLGQTVQSLSSQEITA
jgi:hypothetical protein